MTAAHLSVETSERGFDRLPKIEPERGGYVRAFESSSAEEASIWLAMKDETAHPHDEKEAHVHLTCEEAWKMADQLRYLVRNHYWGDMTPDWAADA